MSIAYALHMPRISTIHMYLGLQAHILVENTTEEKNSQLTT